MITNTKLNELTIRNPEDVENMVLKGPRLNNKNDNEYLELRKEHGYQVCRDLNTRGLLFKIAQEYGLNNDDIMALEDKIYELEQAAKARS